MAAQNDANPRGVRPKSVPLGPYIRTEGLAVKRGEEVMQLTTKPQRVRVSCPSGQLLVRSDVPAVIEYSNGRRIKLAPKVAELVCLPLMQSLSARCTEGTGTLSLAPLGYSVPGTRDHLESDEYRAAVKRGKLKLKH